MGKFEAGGAYRGGVYKKSVYFTKEMFWSIFFLILVENLEKKLGRIFKIFVLPY